MGHTHMCKCTKEYIHTYIYMYTTYMSCIKPYIAILVTPDTKGNFGSYKAQHGPHKQCYIHTCTFACTYTVEYCDSASPPPCTYLHKDISIWLIRVFL